MPKSAKIEKLVRWRLFQLNEDLELKKIKEY